MEIRTKQRLIVSLVLLAILTIFFPLLFCSLHPSMSLFMLMTAVLMTLLLIKSVTQLQLHHTPSTSVGTITGKTDSTSFSLSPQPAQLLIISKVVASKPQPLQMSVKVILAVILFLVPVKVKPKKFFVKKVLFYLISFIYLTNKSIGNSNSEVSDSFNNADAC